MHESPRIRRLRNDLAALERLRAESSVFQFQAIGKPAHHYQIEFHGKSLRANRARSAHPRRTEVEIKLGASYPRTMPEIRWLTPIYHPEHLRDRHGLPGGLRHPLGAQPAPRRALHDALGHGPVSQLRHPQPLQPRGRPLGGQPDVVPLSRPTPGRSATSGRPRDAGSRRPRLPATPTAPDGRPSRQSGPATARDRKTAWNCRPQSSRVRQFLERYGRDFGEAGGRRVAGQHAGRAARRGRARPHASSGLMEPRLDARTGGRRSHSSTRSNHSRPGMMA